MQIVVEDIQVQPSSSSAAEVTAAATAVSKGQPVSMHKGDCHSCVLQVSASQAGNEMLLGDLAVTWSRARYALCQPALANAGDRPCAVQRNTQCRTAVNPCAACVQLCHDGWHHAASYTTQGTMSFLLCNQGLLQQIAFSSGPSAHELFMLVTVYWCTSSCCQCCSC